MTAPGTRALVVLGALACVGWTLDRHATVRNANERYDAGEYAEAAAGFREALIDQPDSGLIRFNLGDATYREGKYDEAAGSFDQVLSTSAEGDPRRARAAYNKGNAKFRLGQDAEQANPQEALSLWADALVAYRQAMGADPADEDAKFNFELVQRKIDELHERMEQEQNEEQQQDEQQQQDQQQPQDQEQRQNQEQGQQQDQAEQQPEPQEPPAGEQAPEESPEDLSQREAQALLDSLRDEEVDPEEIIDRLQGGVVAEPARDW